jgi:hypothetical protein
MSAEFSLFSTVSCANFRYGTGWWGLEEPKFVPFGLVTFLANFNEAICWLTGINPLNKALMKTSVIM